MAERLTDKNTVSIYNNSNSEIYLGKGEEATKYIYKLAQLEDIMEKYGIDVEELNQMLEWLFTLSGQDADDMKFIARDRKLIHQQYCDIKTDRDTWKRACEKMAFNYDAKLKCSACFLKEQCSKQYGGNYEQALSDYFYQQAKKEGNDDK